MTNRNLTGAVILAAGSGSRMGGGLPKQFRMLDGRPMYRHSLETFAEDPAVDVVVLVVDAGHEEAVKRELAEAPLAADTNGAGPGSADGAEAGSAVIVAVGGATRPDSVRNGLAALPDTVRYVLIHDGARPYVTHRVIGGVADAMYRTGAAIPCVAPKDTIRTAERTLERSLLYAVQTPQGFRRDVLEQAYEEAEASGFEGTDDASYVENLGIQVALCDGDPANIKITTPDDMPANWRDKTMIQRIGTGFDVHKFGDTAPDTHIIIGGVAIPYERPLLAHSDGDVLVHAVMDALLGAAGLPDIGHLFPDSDPAYKGADSIGLLTEVGKRLTAEGFGIANVDATLMGQEPKFAPYENAMCENIAAALGIDRAAVNVKATTTEGLGFTGRKEGLAAQAVCLLVKE